MIFDLHVHTVKGSQDSNLKPDELIAEAKRIGLDGVCITEHDGSWDPWDFDSFARQHPELVLVRALEVNTELGHVTVFGLDRYVSGIHEIETLRKVVSSAGGFMVAAHPFRRFFDKPPLFNSLLFKERVPLGEAIGHRMFEMTDAIEVVNGACTLPENEFALKAAHALGKPQVGGSDAHSTNGLGCGATVFERQVRNAADLIAELKAGRCHATNGLLKGHRTPFSLAEGSEISQAAM